MLHLPPPPSSTSINPLPHGSPAFFTYYSTLVFSTSIFQSIRPVIDSIISSCSQPTEYVFPPKANLHLHPMLSFSASGSALSLITCGQRACMQNTRGQPWHHCVRYAPHAAFLPKGRAGLASRRCPACAMQNGPNAVGGAHEPCTLLQQQQLLPPLPGSACCPTVLVSRSCS
jgi:hypothetical protein